MDSHFHGVSILVLVDVPLQSYGKGNFAHRIPGFNPCFSGCTSSIWPLLTRLFHIYKVSILVLVDVPLQYRSGDSRGIQKILVSILVLVDVPLQYVSTAVRRCSIRSFNPCFSGCTSSMS